MNAEANVKEVSFRSSMKMVMGVTQARKHGKNNLNVKTNINMLNLTLFKIMHFDSHSGITTGESKCQEPRGNALRNLNKCMIII